MFKNILSKFTWWAYNNRSFFYFNWWGVDLHVHTATQGGQEQLFELVPFADAGQNKEAYTVLHDGIERSEP